MVQRSPAVHWMVVADEAAGFVLGAVSASQPLCGDMYPCDCSLWFSSASSARAMGGFALHEALRPRVAGVSEPHVVQFPPFGGSPSVALVGVAPKAQTTSAKNAENGRLLARWSAFWAQVCLVGCVVCARTTEHARYTLDEHVNK